MAYDIWARVLYAKYLRLIKLAEDGEIEEFKARLQNFHTYYDKLDLEQQGDYHELVSMGDESLAVNARC